MSRLAELGLSSYEEQCYRALVARGPSSAQAASDASGVPMGRVYDVLNGLAARGLVTTEPTEPTTYAAVPPTEAADVLLAERRSELDAHAQRYERLAEEVGDDLAATPPAEGRFWTAPLGSDAAVTLTERAFVDAESSVRSAMSRPYASAAWTDYEAELTAFHDALPVDHDVRALVDARVLDGVPADVRDRYRDGDAIAVRVTTGLSLTFDVVDDDRVFFHVPHPLDDGERLGGVELRDDALVDRLAHRFERAWDAAKPLGAVR
ncbi:TrmB family transcriptional regulator [Halobacterium yunchengense]|uniref:TrmB family transcriptional regulator n=1 Tax=Halobacterium yunchengense TaxID=3108497 RepID=UPI003009E08D